jgi:hypothetical protein
MLNRIFFIGILFIVKPVLASPLCVDLFAQDHFFSNRQMQFFDLKANLHEFKISEDEKISLLKMEEKAATVAREMDRIRGESVEGTVLYPAAGYDAAAAFLAFSKAKTVIGIDNHPFFLKPETKLYLDVHVKSYDQKGYTWVTDVDRKGEVASVVLARLKHAFPDIRLHRVALFQEGMAEGNKENSRARHGLIVFDTGPGTLVREYIHIHSFFEFRPWWLPAIKKAGFQAILKKGAMGFFSEYSQHGEYLMQVLKEQGGLLVDGDVRYIEEVRGKTYYETSVSRFGYGAKVLLLEYSGMKNNNAVDSHK